MKFLNDADTSIYQYAQPVQAGEYSGFWENTTAGFKNATQVLNWDSERSLMSDEYRPLVDKIQELSGMEQHEVAMYLGDPKYYKDDEGNTYKGLDLTAKRIRDFAFENDEFKAYLTDQGYDYSTVEAMHKKARQNAENKASVTHEEYQNTIKKRTGWGAVGDFAGTMVGMMTDPLDAMSLLVPISSSAKLTTKIAINEAAALTPDILEYDKVKDWHLRVTGEEYTYDEFKKNLAIIGVGTAALTTLVDLPMRAYFQAVQQKAKRILTPKERMEAIELFKEAHAQKNGYTYKGDKEFQLAIDKDEADQLLKANNVIPGDATGKYHNHKVINTVKQLMDDDLSAADVGPRSGINPTKEITDVEKQFMNSETVNANDIKLDEQRFQFKKAVDDIDEEFDPVKAGHVILFEDSNGVKLMVDGHKRLRLAQKSNQPLQAIVLRETAGFTGEIAKVAGIVRNVLDGTVRAGDLKVLNKYPGLADMLDNINMSMLDIDGIADLSNKGFIALQRGMVTEDVARLVGKAIKDERNQIAMFDIIKKSGLQTKEEIEALINRSLKDLDAYDVTQFNKEFKALDLIPERHIIMNDSVRMLEKEISAMKRTNEKLSESSDQYVINQARITQNEKAIKLIREHGDYDGQLSDIITDAAEGLVRAEGEGADIIAGTAINSIREGIESGAYDGLTNSARRAQSNLASEISERSKRVTESSQELSKYSDADLSQAVKDEVAELRDMIGRENEIDPNLANLVVDIDQQGNSIPLSRMMADISEQERFIEYINRCKK